jgi:hypothetical protein
MIRNMRASFHSKFMIRIQYCMTFTHNINPASRQIEINRGKKPFPPYGWVVENQVDHYPAHKILVFIEQQHSYFCT